MLYCRHKLGTTDVQDNYGSFVDMVDDNTRMFYHDIRTLDKRIRSRTMIGVAFAALALYEIHQLKERTVILNRQIQQLKDEQEDTMFDD